MNGNPNAAQKRFHDELREMSYNRWGGHGELHHIVGSKRKIHKYERAGEWLVLLLPPWTHADIKKLGFQWEQDQIMSQKEYYENYFNKEYPVPDGLIRSFMNMKNKHQAMGGYSPYGDDA